MVVHIYLAHFFVEIKYVEELIGMNSINIQVEACKECLHTWIFEVLGELGATLHSRSWEVFYDFDARIASDSGT